MPSELTREGPLDTAEQNDESVPETTEAAPAAPRRLWRRATFAAGIPLLGSAAIVTLMITCCHTAFEINDDTTLNAIVNGDYTGRRSSSFVVAPAMFAYVMRAGYALVPRLPWYGITLYILEIGAWAAIATVAFTLRRRPPVAERIVIVATTMVLMPWMILRLSFTSTSLLLGVAGILMFAASARVRGRVGTAYAVAGGVLLGTASAVRMYSFLGVVIAFAPVVAIIVYKAGIRRTAVFALTIGLFVLVGFGTNRLEYNRSAEWRAFMKTNAARSSLHATPRVSDKNVTRKDLDQIGWSQNDLKLFADFYYPDKRVYTPHAIKTLAELSPRVRDEDSASDMFRKLWGPFVALPLLVGVLLTLRRSRWVTLFTLLSLLWLIAVFVLLILYVRLPNRVLIPLEGGAAFLAVIVPSYLTTWKPNAGRRPKWVEPLAILLVVLFLSGTLWQGIHKTNHISSDNTRALRQRTRAYAALLEIDPKGIFIARGDFFGLNADPLSLHTPFENPNFIPLGWATNSPMFNARIHRAGIQDIYRTLARDPHAYLYGTGIEIRRVALFFKQHRGPILYKKVSPHTIYGYSVWSFHLATQPDRNPLPSTPPAGSG